MPNFDLFNKFVSQTKEGEKLASIPHRWINAYDDKDNWRSMFVEPDLLPDSPIKDYLLEKEMLDDAHPVEHNKIVGLLAESIATDQFLANYGLKEYRNPLIIACTYHDIHEGLTGDLLNKTTAQKFGELKASQDCFVKLAELAPHYQRRDIAKAFCILQRDPKIKDKYQISDHMLALANLKLKATEEYEILGALYEAIHSVSFLISTIGNKKPTYEMLAMQADVLQSQLNKILVFSQESDFVAELVSNPEIVKKIKEALQALRSPIIRNQIKSWGRELKPLKEIHYLEHQLEETLVNLNQS